MQVKLGLKLLCYKDDWLPYCQCLHACASTNICIHCYTQHIIYYIGIGNIFMEIGFSHDHTPTMVSSIHKPTDISLYI